MSIFRVFRSVILLMNIGLAILGVYGYAWRPFFRSGEWQSPYWLVRLYSYITPYSVIVILILFGIFWVFRFVANLLSLGAAKDAGGIVTLLQAGVLISVLATVPSWLVSHDHIDSKDFNTGNFNLMREESFGQTSLILIECSDPGQMSCRTVGRQDNIYVPLNPTPMGEEIVIVEGREVVLQPNYIPTPTPAVRLGVEASSGELWIKMGNDWGMIATPAAESE